MGANTSKQDNQLQLQNQLAQQQLAHTNATLDQVNGAVSPALTGNSGFSPAMLAALNSQALDQNAQRYGQAAVQTNNTLAARGESGMAPLSGVAASGYGNLQASKASDLADSLRTVTLNNAQQANTNKYNAAAILSGGAQTQAGTFGTANAGASSALGNLTTAQQGGFFNNFTKAIGQGLGSAAGDAITGGTGTALSKIGSGQWGF